MPKTLTISLHGPDWRVVHNNYKWPYRMPVHLRLVYFTGGVISHISTCMVQYSAHWYNLMHLCIPNHFLNLILIGPFASMVEIKKR